MDPKKEFSFRLNGKPVTISVPANMTVLKLLRDQLQLTGTKPGCETGHCGSCLVLIDGKPVKSCRTKVDYLSGRNVTTIEGLGEGAPHPIQTAFVKVGAVQCGYCFPGIVLRTKALLDANPCPTREEAAQALSGHICRCGGYVKIIEGVLLAAEWLREGKTSGDISPAAPLFGEAGPQVDSLEKVKGEIIYAGDIYMPGMLVAKLLRSPYHHARLVSLDLEEARALPGIAGIFTAKDIPGVNRIKRIMADQPVLVSDLIRSMGDPIALVVGETEASVAQALKKIKVQYSPIPEILDMNTALVSASLVHPENPEGNIVVRQEMKRGNPDAAFADADLVIENTYTTPFNEHSYLETEAGVSYIDDQGRVVLQACSQAPHYLQHQIASILGIGVEQVRVIQTATGGAFGGKTHISVHAVLALASFLLKRPVKMQYSREESFIATPKRHAFQIKLKTGAKSDGKFVAIKAEIMADTGAYASTGPHVLIQSVLFSTGPYKWDHIDVQGTLVYTNNTLACAMRGFGVPQVAFAIESQIDAMAGELGIDPLQIRLTNAIDDEYIAPWGQPMKGQVGIRQSLQALSLHWQEFCKVAKDKPADRKKIIGIGLAAGWNSNGRLAAPNTSRARLEIKPNGEITVFTGAADIGQGVKTVLAQIVGKSLGITIPTLTVVCGDTETTGNSDITCASKTSLTVGNAVLAAAENLKHNAISLAGKILAAKPTDLFYQDGAIFFHNGKSRSISLLELANKTGAILEGSGSYETAGTEFIPESCEGTPFLVYAGVSMASMVEIDRESGKIKVLKMVAAPNVGRVINPVGAESQIEGSIMMGIGFALTEEYISGKTRGFNNYKIPSTLDVPDIKSTFVEVPHDQGPFGAVGMGEVAIVPVAPSITNAIYNACKIRITDLPVKNLLQQSVQRKTREL